jgi:hypothetical protein
MKLWDPDDDDDVDDQLLSNLFRKKPRRRPRKDEGQSLQLPIFGRMPPVQWNCRCVFADKVGLRDVINRTVLAEVFGVPMEWAVDYALVQVARIPPRKQRRTR